MLNLQKERMELEDNIKKQILKINLASIKKKEYEEGLIKVEKPVFDFFLKTLEQNELYEDCNLLLKNKEKLLIT